jgi:four helix bundle protein
MALSIVSYRDLEVWQQAVELSLKIYALTRSLPKSEQYGLASQMQRSSVSVASNIAEGHQRASTKEYLRFIAIALGSLAELDTQLEIALRAHSTSEIDSSEAKALIVVLGKRLRTLQTRLRAKVSEPASDAESAA